MRRLTKPMTPGTNGRVERFNGRIADVLKTHRFSNREDMQQTLQRYVALYNHHAVSAGQQDAYAGDERVIPKAPGSVS